MEENINIFALVLDELNKNDMWFTTKADPTAEEASSYYKLDEYGEPTEATVKKIEKEVISLIGDGAVYIEDAVELWVNDALVACRIDYKDNLVTQFEDKPVVDNIEAYENPVQFPQSKKVEAKTKKTEYYKMPDDEHIIWDSEVDYYDDDYMEDVKQNQYQDYLDDFEPSEPPTFEDWVMSEECYDTHYNWFEDTGITEWSDLVDEYRDEFKEDYDDYVANYKDEPLPFDKWYSNYIKDASYDDWEYLEDDLKSNIFPEIDKQVNDDVLILSGYYGSNYPDFKSSGAGGKLFEKGTKDFRDYMSNFDRVCITTQNGILGAVLGDHDGTVSGQFFTLPDDKSELFKALDLENKVKEDYTDQEIDWENGTVGEYDSMGNYRNYDLEDLVEKEFYELLEYGGLDARDFTTHLELLKPIKDTISGYANKSESKEVKTEAEPFNEVIYGCFDRDGELLIDFKDKEEAIRYFEEHDEVDSVKEIINNYDGSEVDQTIGKEVYPTLEENKKIERKKKQIEAFKNRKVNFKQCTKDKKVEALVDNFYTAFEMHGFRRHINEDTTIEELINELYNFITFENISQDDMRKAIRDIVNHINVQFNANLDPERMYLWYINGNYGGTYEKVCKNKITENYQRRLDEVNNKSKNLISDLFSSNDFDGDSPAGQIVMRTSEMFNALSDKGYDVEVTFDNGESTSAIQLGQQGGKVMITITNTDQPLRAFTSGNFEINDQNIKILQDIQSQIEVL